MSAYRFKRGDYIRAEKTTGGHITVLYGTAMEDKGWSGFAVFEMRVQGVDELISLNLNTWETTLIFSADVARGEA